MHSMQTQNQGNQNRISVMQSTNSSFRQQEPKRVAALSVIGIYSFYNLQRDSNIQLSTRQSSP